MSALTEEGPGQSTCRAVSATPLQIYNMHVTEYIPGIDVKPSPVAGPRLSSCPVHKDIPCIAKIPHCLPWHQELAVTVGELRGSGSGVGVS